MKNIECALAFSTYYTRNKFLAFYGKQNILRYDPENNDSTFLLLIATPLFMDRLIFFR